MSLEKTQVARPKATVIFGGASGATVSPESITLTIQVNSFPRADIRYHDKGDTNKARSAVPEDLATKLAQDQTSMFEAASSARVFMEDGLGGSISFRGYQTNSSYEIMTGGIGYSASAVHASAVLDTLQTSVYRFGNKLWRDYANTPKGGGTYSSWMSAVLERMLEEWNTHVQTGNLDELTKATVIRAHNNNEVGLTALRAVLSASTDKNQKLTELGTDDNFKKNITFAIFNIYASSYGSFLQAIQQFGLQFQTIYVPDIGEGFGKYIRTSDVIQQELTKKVHIMRMYLSAGAKSIVPVTQIMVQGMPADYWRAGYDNHTKFMASPAISTFPPNVTTGRVYVVSAPSWLPTDTTPERTTEAEGKQAPDPAAYADNRTLVDKEHRKELDTTVRETIDEWAKNIYIDMALADSSAQITVPLDFTWEIGKVYKITAEGAKGQKNKDLFTGFLAGITHNLSSLQDTPQAYTSLMFTHVQGEGFTLPGLE